MRSFVVVIYISAVKSLQWSHGNPEASNPDPRMGRTVLGQLQLSTTIEIVISTSPSSGSIPDVFIGIFH